MVKLRVKEILKEKNRSKYWLFNKLNDIENISYSNFNNLVENKTKSIRYVNIEKLCKILECTPDDLFQFSE